MSFFMSLTNRPLTFELEVGQETGVSGPVIKITEAHTSGKEAKYLLPQSLLDKAESNPHFENMDAEDRCRYFLHLMLEAAEDLDAK
ncbi:hypothetical protein Q5H93_12480 [Hymenobacter sp. ASUV-10]|uniref:Uncharacterized protein n=1 Tax=Hymenobacter aranciens TaxID=3063996 RepID=A0ABT9BBI5_9BACT|nr:hypothetical protein [Hymenobacter sp. ASUV-10]MDO7875552.1 hypothetical protein [Hymenobacter sp. ASUV-10]